MSESPDTMSHSFLSEMEVGKDGRNWALMHLDNTSSIIKLFCRISKHRARSEIQKSVPMTKLHYMIPLAFIIMH